MQSSLLVSSLLSDMDFIKDLEYFIRNSFLMILKIFKEIQTNIYQN